MTIESFPGNQIYGFGSVWAHWKKMTIQKGYAREDSIWNSGVLVSGLPVSHQTMFYDRKKFLAAGFLDETLRTSSDYKHLTECFLKGYRMLVTKKKIAIVDNSGISSKQGNLVLEEHVSIVNENLGLNSLNLANQVLRAGKGWLNLDPGLVIPKEVNKMIDQARDTNSKIRNSNSVVILLFGYAIILG